MENVKSPLMFGPSVATKWILMSILTAGIVAVIVHGFLCHGMMAMIILGVLCALGILCATIAYLSRLNANKEIVRLELQLEAEKERQKVQTSQHAVKSDDALSSASANVHDIPVRLHLSLSSQPFFS